MASQALMRSRCKIRPSFIRSLRFLQLARQDGIASFGSFQSAAQSSRLAADAVTSKFGEANNPDAFNLYDLGLFTILEPPRDCFEVQASTDVVSHYAY